jgi:hypothetical protein
MPLWKQALLRRYQAPAGDDGSDTGGTDVVDRGDDFTPTEGDADDIDPDNPDGELKKPAAKAEPEAKAEDDKPKKGGAIPLDRHKEILEKEREARKELEARLANFEKGTKVAAINEDLTKMEDKVLAMEKQYNKLLADGDVDKAADVMTQIRRAERDIVEAKADMKIQASVAQATEAARYNIALERVEDAYPALNPDSDEFNNELLMDVADMKALFQGRGMTPTEALQKAVKRIMGAPQTRTQATATEVAPRVSEADVAAERKKGAVSKTADAVTRQPPSTANVGMDSDKAGGGLTSKDVMKMSQEDFMKLSEEQIARLRGDAI